MVRSPDRLSICARTRAPHRLGPRTSSADAHVQALGFFAEACPHPLGCRVCMRPPRTRSRYAAARFRRVALGLGPVARLDQSQELTLWSGLTRSPDPPPFAGNR